MKKLIVALLVAAICIVAPAVAVGWDDLPTSMMVMIDCNYPPGEVYGTYFDVYLFEDNVIEQVGADFPETVYPGWCVDTGSFSITQTPYSGCLSSTIGISSDWNKVNWILNNKGDASWSEIQAAIWEIMGQNNPHPEWYTSVAENLVENADASYIPGDCAVGAVLIEACEQQGQTVIIEIPTDCPSVVPEFPTMIIPVFLVGGMLIVISAFKRE